MAPSKKVVSCSLYVPDKRVVLVFSNDDDAETFKQAFSGAEVYANKTRVFLPTPHSLESVKGGKTDETAFLFQRDHDARDWLEKLQGYGVMYPEGDRDAPGRTVFLAQRNTHTEILPFIPVSLDGSFTT